jgi:hypothetical protein
MCDAYTHHACCRTSNDTEVQSPVVGIPGIEPEPPAPKAGALPLRYIPLWAGILSKRHHARFLPVLPLPQAGPILRREPGS